MLYIFKNVLQKLFFFSLWKSQEKDLRDITDEIRKLKAIIVKHENRIRALEATIREQEDNTDSVAAKSNNTSSSNDTKANAAESNSTKEDANGSAGTTTAAGTASDDV